MKERFSSTHHHLTASMVVQVRGFKRSVKSPLTGFQSGSLSLRRLSREAN